MILKFTDIRKKLPFRMNLGLSACRIGDILEEKYEQSFDFDVYLPSKGLNLQRPFCWSLFQNQQLILSLLKGINIPLMAFVHYEHKVFKVIDGKQRLNAWITFCKGNFPIIWNEQEYFFKDLDSYAQDELLWRTWVKADVAYEYANEMISDDNKIAWFELINFSGTTQDEEHLNKLKNF